MVASNTNDCFREFIGQKVKGVLFGALPRSRPDLAASTKTLVFEDGRGLTIAGNGSFWIDSKEDVGRAIGREHDRLKQTKKEIAGILALAGAQ